VSPSARKSTGLMVWAARTACIPYIYMYILSVGVLAGPRELPVYHIHIYVCIIRGLIGLGRTNCLYVLYVYVYRIRQFSLTYIQLYHDTCLQLCWSAPRELPVYVYVYIIRGLVGLRRVNCQYI